MAKDFGFRRHIDQLHGGPGASTYSFYNGIATAHGIRLRSSADTDTRTTLNGFFKLDALKLGAGWLERKVDTGAATTPKQTTMWLQADYVMAQWDFTGGVFNVSQTGQATDTKANMVALRAIYNFDDQLSSLCDAGLYGQRQQLRLRRIWRRCWYFTCRRQEADRHDDRRSLPLLSCSRIPPWRLCRLQGGSSFQGLERSDPFLFFRKAERV